MGVGEETGPEVKNLAKGDRVVVPFPIACGQCFFCERDLPGHCENSNPEHYGPEGGLLSEKGGGLFGYTDLYGGYSGGQAEYVRVPYGDFGHLRGRDEQGEAFDLKLAFTDTYIKRHGRWLVWASQHTDSRIEPKQCQTMTLNLTTQPLRVA